MKRMLIVALVCVMVFSAIAFASWKFGVEQGVDVVGGVYPLEAYFGFDFNAPFIDMTALSIAGDIVVSRVYNWVVQTPSQCILTLDSKLVFSYEKSVDVIFTMDGEINYDSFPSVLELLSWGGGVEIVGRVNSVLTLNAGVNLMYDGTPAPSDLEPIFFFGFDAAW